MLKNKFLATSVSQPASQPVNQQASQPTSQSTNQPVSKSVCILEFTQGITVR
jgi:hypothetical protein